MTDPENFLTRWSRRKQDAEREQDLPKPITKDEPAEPGTEVTGDKQKEIEFDISTLPSLESITAHTDMRVFLQKGVPLDLARAALRRAWTSDPAIRDFIEVAENQWDFATGSDIPGFGPLEPSEEIRQMVESMFQAPADTAKPEDAAQQKIAEENDAATQQTDSDSHAEEIVRRPSETVAQLQPSELHENVASQHENAPETDALPARKRHGSALPE